MGHSAGARLAALICTDDRYVSVVFRHEVRSGEHLRRNNPVAAVSVVHPGFHPSCFDDIGRCERSGQLASP
jgi:hypothetical protein